MVMVSENHSGNLNGASLQFLQFPTMIATENIVKKKLKIKIASKRIEAEPETESCEFGQRVFMNDECGHSIPVKENKMSNVTKSHKLLIPSSGAKKLCGAGNLKLKTSTMGSRKHGLPGVGDGQKEKRRKMDRCMTHQCSSILTQLMTHPAGWVFNQPVDPVNLNIPDYFSVITQPMDLGTIKTKLQNNTYSKVEEFAADVRLTFSNAMVYNPPPNNVNFMAKELSNIFNTRWNCLEAKWNHQHTNVEQGCRSSGRSKNTNNPGQTPPLHASLLPKRLMSAEEKQKLSKQLLEVSKENLSPYLQGFLNKIGFNRQREGRTEVDIDAFDDETLWELKRIIRISLSARAAKVGSAKKADNSRRLSIGMIFSQDLSSEKSLGQDHFDASRKDCEAKSLSASQMSKSDPDSDGAVSALDKEHFCSSPQLTVATTAASGEGWTPPIDIQLSPKKVLRAAMLKSRFADTILKAKQKTLLDHGDKADPVKMQQEKERLERQQLEEKGRIEAQIRAAEAATRMKAAAELKMQREQEREAARLALQKMEKTVEIDDNLVILKDLEMLSRSLLSDNLFGSESGTEEVLGVHFGNPLERLGLFMKDDYIGDEDEEAILNGDSEEGEIFS